MTAPPSPARSKPEIPQAQEKSTAHHWAPSPWILQKPGFQFWAVQRTRAARRMGTRSADHPGCPDGGDGYTPDSPSAPTAKN